MDINKDKAVEDCDAVYISTTTAFIYFYKVITVTICNHD